MRVIHGIWAHGSLCLWAEDPDLPPVPESAPRGARLLPPHPFACQAAELADTLAGWQGRAGDAARKAVHDELTLRLPTAGGGPPASPPLVRPEGPEPAVSSPARRGPVQRGSPASWRVPGLPLRPRAAPPVARAVPAGPP